MASTMLLPTQMAALVGVQPPLVHHPDSQRPLCSRAVAPRNMESLLTPTSDSEQRLLLTDPQQEETPTAAITRTAIWRAAALPESQFSDSCLCTELLNQRMLGQLGTNTPVTDCALLLHMISRHFPLWKQPEISQVSPEALSAAIVQERPQLIYLLPGVCSDKLLHHLMLNTTLARQVIRFRPDWFFHAPQEIKTQALLAPLMASMQTEQRDILLSCITAEDLNLALALAPVRDVVRVHPGSLLEVVPLVTPEERFTLCLQAMQQQAFDWLEPLQDVLNDGEYQKLCDMALSISGRALEYMSDSDRTAERVDKALAHRQAPFLTAIPQPLFTETRLRLALDNFQGEDFITDTNTQTPAFFIQWNLWDQLITKEKWLAYLPCSERSEELCSLYIAQNPARAHYYEIPAAIKAQHPEWHNGFYEPGLYLPLRAQPRSSCNRVHAARITALPDKTRAAVRACAPQQPADSMQPWALLLAGHWAQLPHRYKKLIWDKGGTAGLAQAFQAPAFRIIPQALLDPVQEQHCTNRAAWLPGQVAQKLMFCDHFRPRNAARGLLLHQQMAHAGRTLRCALNNGQLDVMIPVGTWERRGARTLVRSTTDGCLHMKLQRQGECLDSFAAEQAVQNFARNHADLDWHSEIPRPEGMRLVPLDAPQIQEQDFPDAPQMWEHQGRQYALAFLFTTTDNSYDTLAWQADDLGGFRQARHGLLRAFHDLGVWSSLGAVHSSTIRLYHHYYEIEGARPELLLNEFFRPGRGYPGTLHLWNTQATDQSDWGWTGLRDLGDLEFYGFIDTYVASVDAAWIPPDYGQRASFVNAIAQNIFGGLLHYMRLHRATDPDYHYQNTRSVAQLAKFIEHGCDALLAGLLGKGVRFRELFAATWQGLAEVYPEWLRRTAEEIIYWSARQKENSDCFAEHLHKEGRPCAQLYPGHPRQNVRYGHGRHDDYTEAAGESLGTDNGKLPLFFLMRGLYVLAAGLADRLSEAPEPQPMES
ncbi:MAG: hypothetical protein OXC07_10320 [Kistimonas sp.]|nr:hypothetical protein [Kistimonas sp.]